MKDKIIPGFLIFTMWVFIGTIWFKPLPVNAHDDGHTHYASDIYNLEDLSRSDVENIIEDCSMDGGYISDGYLYGLSISC